MTVSNEDSGVASRDQDARPQTEAGVGATPSSVTPDELLRALINMNFALAAAMDDEARPFFFRKIIATKLAATDLIERAGGSTNLVRVIPMVRETPRVDGSHHASEPREDAQRRATPVLNTGEGL